MSKNNNSTKKDNSAVVDKLLDKLVHESTKQHFKNFFNENMQEVHLCPCGVDFNPLCPINKKCLDCMRSADFEEVAIYFKNKWKEQEKNRENGNCYGYTCRIQLRAHSNG